MPSISVPGAIVAAGVVGAGASMLSSSNSASAAESAANTQAAAANNASAATLAMFQQNQTNLAPYRNLGIGGIAALESEFGINGGGGTGIGVPQSGAAAGGLLGYDPTLVGAGSGASGAAGAATNALGGGAGMAPPTPGMATYTPPGGIPLDANGNPTIATDEYGINTWDPYAPGGPSADPLTTQAAADAAGAPFAYLGGVNVGPPVSTSASGAAATAPTTTAPAQPTAAGGNTLLTPYPGYQPFQPTLAQLEQTPGYQFTLGQGLQATQNGFAAQGLGSSGAALKGAANYAEGLAGTTYQQQYQDYVSNYTTGLSSYESQISQLYNLLGGTINTGANAAGTTAGLGANAVAASNSSLLSGAAASAAGTVGSANALNSGLSGVSSAGSNTALLYALNNAGMFGGGNSLNSPVAAYAGGTGG